ncbi:MAG: phosphate regulon sensor histidine kinase PhoR, partial [Gammaproteobacteria bacterium]|nr:phosphate regulon sensor histidine kinase PhoR [Gammaproteobacteria bacterium]
ERKARKALSRFDARFREAATVFPDALAVVSRSRNVRWCNPSAEKLLFGQAFEKLGNQTLQTLLPDPRLDRYLADGQFDQPLVFSPPHDRSRVISIRIMPFGKKKHQLLVVGSDITRVHHLDAARRDFIANVSHELRTPLTVIAGYLDPLTEYLEGDAEWSASLRLMEQQAQRMGQMIDDLTLLSHLETAEKPLREKRLDIAALLNKLAEEARAIDDAGWQQIELDIDDQLFLSGDETELRSAFGNLLMNAIRHNPAGTRIILRWENEPDGPAFTVADDGPGIDKDKIPRLTERFYRIDPSRSRSSGGTGLGLAIVKHVMKRHEGTLLIHSQPGAGSRFVCQFPQARTIFRTDTFSNHA